MRGSAPRPPSSTAPSARSPPRRAARASWQKLRALRPPQPGPAHGQGPAGGHRASPARTNRETRCGPAAAPFRPAPHLKPLHLLPLEDFALVERLCGRGMQVRLRHLLLLADVLVAVTLNRCPIIPACGHPFAQLHGLQILCLRHVACKSGGRREGWDNSHRPRRWTANKHKSYRSHGHTTVLPAV